MPYRLTLHQRDILRKSKKDGRTRVERDLKIKRNLDSDVVTRETPRVTKIHDWRERKNLEGRR